MTSVARHPATVRPDQTTFFLEKGRVRPILLAIFALQKRDDLSGKFAKKLGIIRRAIAHADEEVVAQRQDLLEVHAEKDDLGKFLPVYAEHPDGRPIFVKDDKGNDTEERMIVPDQYRLKDRKAYEQAIKDLVKEIIVVECPCFHTKDGVPELELFKSVKGEVIDLLLDLEEGADTTKAPLALVASDEPDEPQTSAPAAEEVAAEDRSAP
jgi:hypothetical protein